MDADIRIIPLEDERYPAGLRIIAQPPKQLYMRGDWRALHSTHLLAVVGSRKANPYGKQCVETLLPDVVRSGIVIVSGLAFGIDSLAHQAAVREKNPTVAVLGTGVDSASVYP
ncbi:MAG: DNA-processing protein DprA, partial [Candidatus Binatia bacterium]